MFELSIFLVGLAAVVVAYKTGQTLGKIYLEHAQRNTHKLDKIRIELDAINAQLFHFQESFQKLDKP